MSRSGGIRPVPKQKNRPISKVTHWILDTYGEVGLDGRPLPRQRPRFEGTITEAKAARQRLVAELIAQGAAPAPAAPLTEPAPSQEERDKPKVTTYRAYLRDVYLPHVKEEHPASTYRTKSRHFENHIIPTLGDLLVEEANTRAAVNRLKCHLVEHPRIRKNSFRNLILLTFSASLSHAVDLDEPLLTEKIKVKLFPEDKRKGVSVAGFKAGHLRQKRYSEEEIQRLLDAADTMPNPAWWRVLVLLGAALGCRVGEAAARKWSDVNWESRQIEINSIICSETTEEMLDHTKTSVLAGNPLSDEVFEALQKLRKEPGSRKSQYILGAGENRPYLTVANVEDRFGKLTRRAFGKKCRTYHRLRHTCASALADAGENPEVIRQLMRHDSLKTTYGYIQPAQASLQQAVRKLNFSRKTAAEEPRTQAVPALRQQPDSWPRANGVPST